MGASPAAMEEGRKAHCTRPNPNPHKTWGTVETLFVILVSTSRKETDLCERKYRSNAATVAILQRGNVTFTTKHRTVLPPPRPAVDRIGTMYRHLSQLILWLRIPATTTTAKKHGLFSRLLPSETLEASIGRRK